MRAALATLLCSSAAWAAPVAVAAPDRVVLGSDAQAEIAVRGLPAWADLRHAASSGTLAPLPPGRGTHRFTWTPPPDVRFPTWTVLLFWDAASATPEVAVLRLPLVGRTELDMATEPLAEVRVEVAGRSFGPVTAGARGRVKIPIEVPPGVRTAKVHATASGRETTRTVPLEVPPTTPFALAAGPEPMPPGGGWLLAAVAGETASAVQAEATGARLQPGRRTGGDATFKVLPGEGARAVELRVSLPKAAPQRVQVAVGERSARLLPPGAVGVHALAGGYVAGGANRGLALELGGGYRLPALDGRLFAELSVGLRTSALGARVPAGRVDARLYVVPVELGLRCEVFERGALALAARAGGGALPWRQRVTADFQPAATLGGVGFEAFGAVQGRYRLAGGVDLLAEVRGAWAQARSTRLEARPGGLNLALGARWSPR